MFKGFGKNALEPDSENQVRGILVFENTTEVIKAENVLKAKGWEITVAGFVHPLKIMTNAQAKPGDVLILTKPLGVGIINTAIKAGMASETAIRESVLSMSTLNRLGKEATQNISGVHSITDITGFGLLGHAIEMAEGSKVTFRIKSTDIPYISEAKEYANMGLIPVGTYKNKAFFAKRALINEQVPTYYQDILIPRPQEVYCLRCQGKQRAASG